MHNFNIGRAIQYMGLTIIQRRFPSKDSPHVEKGIAVKRQRERSIPALHGACASCMVRLEATLTGRSPLVTKEPLFARILVVVSMYWVVKRLYWGDTYTKFHSAK